MARRKEAVKTVESTRQYDYEMVVILSPDIADEALDAAIENIKQFITGKAGIVDEVEKWGKRRLAYPIARFLEGNYILAKFKISPTYCKELEASLKIS